MSDDISLSEAERGAGIVRCDACPVLCRIRPGRAGACDRYANEDGKLLRVDPLVREVVAAVDRPAGLWPSLLPRLRARARLSVADVAAAIRIWLSHSSAILDFGKLKPGEPARMPS